MRLFGPPTRHALHFFFGDARAEDFMHQRSQSLGDRQKVSGRNEKSFCVKETARSLLQRGCVRMLAWLSAHEDDLTVDAVFIHSFLHSFLHLLFHSF